MSSKVINCREAVELIKDGDTVAVGGFVGNCHPEEHERSKLAIKKRSSKVYSG